jgi:hypothetical protein
LTTPAGYDRQHVATTRSIASNTRRSLTAECPNSGLSGSGPVRWESGHLEIVRYLTVSGRIAC